MNTKITDPYSTDALGVEFGDYFNEFSDIILGINNSKYKDEEIKQILAEHPLKEVEKRFEMYYEHYPKSKEAVANHPVKVSHINQMAKIANTCTTVRELKPILNEIFRLIYGKNNEIPFPGKEFDPELVSIKIK